MNTLHSKIKNRGYALYTAIILTGILILVAYSTANLTARELQFSSTAADSHIAFYNTDTGLECALYWDLKNGPVSAFDGSTPGTITCNGQTISSGSQTVQTTPNQPSVIGGAGGAAVGNSATPIGTDDTTQGSWIGKYGSQGYNVISYSGSYVNYPAYVTVTPAANDTYEWENPTADVGGLQVPPSGASRIAAAWYSSAPWTITFNFTDGISHHVSLYMLDRDGFNTRSQTVQVYDADTNALLDTQQINNFSSGKYVTWNISGHVYFNFIQTGTYNSVVSGVFIDPGGNASGSSIFQLNLNPGCVIVQVTKGGGTTLIESRGYNTCSGSRRLERGVKIQY